METNNLLTVSGGDALTPETVELDTMDTMEATEAAGETEALETMETMEALETMETMEEISNEENIRLLTDIESSLSETIATLLEENNEIIVLDIDPVGEKTSLSFTNFFFVTPTQELVTPSSATYV